MQDDRDALTNQRLHGFPLVPLTQPETMAIENLKLLSRYYYSDGSAYFSLEFRARSSLKAIV